jgi:hypothetical protein
MKYEGILFSFYFKSSQLGQKSINYRYYFRLNLLPQNSFVKILTSGMIFEGWAFGR